MTKLSESIAAINSKEDFIVFIQLLLEDFNNNKEQWGNKTLETYLEGIESWTNDMEGYYINNKLPIPTDVNWKVFADVLMAAKMYE